MREAPEGSTGCPGLWMAGVPALEFLGRSLEDEVGWWGVESTGDMEWYHLAPPSA